MGGDRSADEEVMQLKLQELRGRGGDYQESEGRGRKGGRCFSVQDR